MSSTSVVQFNPIAEKGVFLNYSSEGRVQATPGPSNIYQAMQSLRTKDVGTVVILSCGGTLLLSGIGHEVHTAARWKKMRVSVKSLGGRRMRITKLNTLDGLAEQLKRMTPLARKCMENEIERQFGKYER